MKKIFILILIFYSNSFALKESYSIFSQALILEKEGKYDSAMEYYKKAIAIDPQLFIYKQALNLALQTGKLKEAKEYSEYIVKNDSTSAESWFLYGNSLWASGEIQEAKKAFEKVIEIDPEYADAYYQLSSLNMNNVEKAVNYLKKFLELKPDYKPEIYYQIALIYQSKNDEKKMFEYIKKSLDEDPSYLKPRYFMASYYESKGNFKDALKEYEKILEMDPDNIEILNHIGEIYLSSPISDLEKAERYFLDTLKISSSDPSALYWLSTISEEKKDYEKAASYLERSSEVFNNPSTGLKLSYYYTLINRYPDAINVLEKLHNKWPDNREISYFLALGYEDMGKYPDAYNLLMDIVSKKTDNQDAIMQLAIVCEKLNNVNCFEDNFRKLLKINPDNHIVLNYLGYSLIDRGLKIDEAIDMIKKALEKDPDNGAYLDSLGWGYYKKGDYEKAFEYIEKSLKIIKFDPVVWEHIGELYYKKGDINKAWLAYKISCNLSSDDKKAEIKNKILDLYKNILVEESIYKYFRTFSLFDTNFSAFAKVSVRFKNKNIKLDSIISYMPDGRFNISFIGPLMTPIWQIDFSNDILKIQDFNMDGINNDFLNSLATDISTILRDFFNSKLISLPYTDTSKKYIEKDNMKIYFSAESQYIDKIKFSGKNKFEIIFSKYENIKNYIIPSSFEIKASYAKIIFELDLSKINIGDVNSKISFEEIFNLNGK